MKNYLECNNTTRLPLSMTTSMLNYLRCVFFKDALQNIVKNSCVVCAPAMVYKICLICLFFPFRLSGIERSEIDHSNQNFYRFFLLSKANTFIKAYKMEFMHQIWKRMSEPFFENIPFRDLKFINLFTTFTSFRGISSWYIPKDK